MTFAPLAALARMADQHGIAFEEAFLPRSERLARPGAPSLHYLSWRGTGAPALFLHGGALTAHTWDLVCLALSPRYHCVALDLRGHGESDWADEYSIDHGVEDVLALCQGLGWDRLHLVGMSLGGNIAGHAAPRLGARLASLALVDIAPHLERDGTAQMRRFMAEARAHESVDALVDAALAVSPRGGRDRLRYRYHYMTRSDGDGWSFRHDTRSRPDFVHIFERLHALESLAGSIACPFLLARGAQSRVLGAEAAGRFVARFPRGRAVTIERAGHNVQEDNPRALAEALAAHFALGDSP